LINPKLEMSINRQMKILGLNKSGYYYKPRGSRPDEARICAAIDREHLDHPAKGVIQMRDFLVAMGVTIGVKRTRRLMRKMAIEPFYPKPNLSKLGRAKYVHPYLLRDMKIDHAGQVWSTDITYIPMPKGFLYLYAIIDVYSRYIVGWGLYSTLESDNAIEVLNRAIEEHGKPEAINSDQGSQYTSQKWTDTLKEKEISISMDGRGRCRDNAWIERFWRTLKAEYVYLNPWGEVALMRDGIRGYIDYYNKRRCHSSIGHVPPAKLFFGIASKAA
jgi:putative transposase